MVMTFGVGVRTCQVLMRLGLQAIILVSMAVYYAYVRPEEGLVQDDSLYSDDNLSSEVYMVMTVWIESFYS